jgi:hypothetical protein
VWYNAPMNWIPITVIHAQDDRITRTKGHPPEQVIRIGDVEVRSRDPEVIACLFSGSEDEDTDWDNVATAEWLHWVNHYVNEDDEVRFGLLEALGREHPVARDLLAKERREWVLAGGL